MRPWAPRDASLAFRVRLRALDHTLTDAEVLWMRGAHDRRGREHLPGRAELRLLTVHPRPTERFRARASVPTTRTYTGGGVTHSQTRRSDRTVSRSAARSTPWRRQPPFSWSPPRATAPSRSGEAVPPGRHLAADNDAGGSVTTAPGAVPGAPRGVLGGRRQPGHPGRPGPLGRDDRRGHGLSSVHLSGTSVLTATGDVVDRPAGPRSRLRDAAGRRQRCGRLRGGRRSWPAGFESSRAR